MTVIKHYFRDGLYKWKDNTPPNLNRLCRFQLSKRRLSVGSSAYKAGWTRRHYLHSLTHTHIHSHTQQTHSHAKQTHISPLKNTKHPNIPAPPRLWYGHTTPVWLFRFGDPALTPQCQWAGRTWSTGGSCWGLGWGMVSQELHITKWKASSGGSKVIRVRGYYIMKTLYSIRIL